MEPPLPPLSPGPDIRGLRAIAVGVVILGHVHLPGFDGGFVGVDVFFVLSGFLISSLLLHEATTTGRVRLGHFYARRARRILPAAGLVLMATAVFAALRLPLTRVSEVVDDVRSAALFTANIHFSRPGTDYFEDTRAASPVQHMWSLAVEEQFYPVWPLVVAPVFALSLKRRQRFTRMVVGLARLGSLGWSVALTSAEPVAAYFSSVTRARELATGALLALAGHQLVRLRAWSRRALALGGLATIGLAVVTFDASTPFPGWRAALPVLGTAAVIAAGAGGSIGMARILTVRPMRYVGDLSYSLYLWHWPVLVLGAYELGHPPGALESAMLVVVLSGAAVLSFHLLEDPIRHQRFSVVHGVRALALWPVTLLLVLGTATWAHAHATSAFEARIRGNPDRVLDPAVASAAEGVHSDRRTEKLAEPDIGQLIRDALEQADADRAIPFPLVNFDNLRRDSWHLKYACHADWEQTSYSVCNEGDRRATRTVALYGDSHAGMWLPPPGPARPVPRLQGGAADEDGVRPLRRRPTAPRAAPPDLHALPGPGPAAAARLAARRGRGRLSQPAGDGSTRRPDRGRCMVVRCDVEPGRGSVDCRHASQSSQTSPPATFDPATA
ncbi:acyltransferase family protein [Nocardioides sp. B-3]|uniref:acyltransferase family protein n=1 Tax=Nocardioides sp. B-3 TaxID=2895565 RepID=UPI0021534317|nr:acyltransferase [Nocardioides sp. B-3]UUZ61448.1 acyltransferase [Nocardioides sp. B-3]